MILFWGLKKMPLLLEIPTLKDHLKRKPQLLALPGYRQAAHNSEVFLK
jgi:hypothetical protein